MELALAKIIEGVVANVISIEAGATAATLGLAGTWVEVEDGTVGVGFLFNEETGEFSRPPEPPPEETPE